MFVHYGSIRDEIKVTSLFQMQSNSISALLNTNSIDTPQTIDLSFYPTNGPESALKYIYFKFGVLVRTLFLMLGMYGF